jgi:hypothetical protein
MHCRIDSNKVYPDSSVGPEVAFPCSECQKFVFSDYTDREAGVSFRRISCQFSAIMEKVRAGKKWLWVSLFNWHIPCSCLVIWLKKYWWLKTTMIADTY